MSEMIKTMVDMLNTTSAGFASVKMGKYTLILTDDDKGAERMTKAWDEYVNEESED